MPSAPADSAPRRLPARRPAETTALAGAVALLLARATGLADDPATVTALAVLIGALPSLVTGLHTGCLRPKRRSPQRRARRTR